MDRNAPEIFRVLLGNLASGDRCIVRLRLAMTLTSDTATGQIRFGKYLKTNIQKTLFRVPKI